MNDQPSLTYRDNLFRSDTDMAALGRDYRILIEHSPDAIVVHEGRDLVFVNPAGLALIGATDARQVVGHPLAEFVSQDSIPAMVSRIRDLDHIGAVSRPSAMVLRRLGGRLVEVEAVSVLTRWAGRPAYQVVLRNLSAQRAAEAAATRAEQRYASIVATLVEGVVVMDSRGIVESMNPAAARILGVDAASAIGAHLSQTWSGAEVVGTDEAILPREDHPHVRTQQTAAPVSFVVGLRWPGRPILWTSGTCKPLDPGVNSSMVVSFTDISEARTATAQLEHQATHDSLTDLPNRLDVVTAIGSAIDDPHRRTQTAVLFCDLDNLGAVNASLGHSVGDEVLREVAVRLRDVVGTDSLVGRVGGDEFVAVLPGDPSRTESVAAHIHRALAAPIERVDWEVVISASIGAVTVPVGDTRTIDDLLRDADVAMSAAKAAGGNRTQVFDEESKTCPAESDGLQPTADTSGRL